MENTPINPWIGAGTDIATGIINTTYNAYQANRQREWSEKMMDKQNDWSLMMWNKTNAYNTPTEQVNRLTSAGLNPLYYGLDGSSANGLESAQPLNYERAESSMTNPLDSYIKSAVTNKQLELLEAQKENVDADTDQKKAGTSGLILDNEWKRRTMEARVESENLANNLTEKQISKIDKEMSVMDKELSKMDSEIRKIDAEYETELGRKFLVQAETNLKKMTAQQIAALLPYQQNLMEAQTDAQKAAAVASMIHAGYEYHLLDSGYIDAMVDELNAKTNNEEWAALMNKWKHAVRTGTVFDDSGNNAFSRFLNDKIIGPMIGNFSVLGEMLQPIASIIGVVLNGAVSGAAAGRAVGKSGSPVVNNYVEKPKGSGQQFGPSFTINPDGSTNWTR